MLWYNISSDQIYKPICNNYMVKRSRVTFHKSSIIRLPLSYSQYSNYNTTHTLALASRVASASAAIARCKLAGSRTSLLQ